jgi:ribosomal protein L40E
MTTETLFEKMRTRECLDCGVVGFAGPPTAEHCHKCVLEHLSAKATAIYGGGEVLDTEELKAGLEATGLTVLVFE